MNMFCYQCQEAAGNTGCINKGACGKNADTASLQDLLIFVLKGISFYVVKNKQSDPEIGRFICNALFSTITNGNFDNARIQALIDEGLKIRESLKLNTVKTENMPNAAIWTPSGIEEYAGEAGSVGILSTEDADVRSLRELLIYGLKGIGAYAHHAAILGHEDTGIYQFIYEALSSTLKNLSTEEMIQKVLEAGEIAVRIMALLDKANTETYGNPEITEVNISTGTRPGILVSGHDLKDLEELLEQTKGTEIDVYTHGEMLPAHYYPAFKKYDNLAGNYGNAWWKQNQEFEAFNGPILMTTNCIIPVKDSYKDRIFTTGATGYPGCVHIPDRPKGGTKDFSAIIKMAKKSTPPQELEKGSITGGFAHAQVMALADKIVEAVKNGAIKRFVVMAGCDGRHTSRSYFTDVAKSLPQDAVILTAGCAKYRYNKLDLGDIGGIPRVLDAGQCNDCYSLALIALKLKEVFALDDINDLPISFDIAWYEQKAVTVLLALLHLGFKGMRLGPTLPAFLSPNVAKVLVENFNIKPTGDVQADIEKMMKAG